MSDEAEMLANRIAYIDQLRALYRKERLAGLFLILTGFMLVMPSWNNPAWPHAAILAGYGLIAGGWVTFIYVIWRRTAWRRANPFDPKA
ncbi:MAG: hypothetical protein Q8L23_01350 [Caulobacter sp.]|nr:hypothetical protein [Caulobacter sp.]